MSTIPSEKIWVVILVLLSMSTLLCIAVVLGTLAVHVGSMETMNHVLDATFQKGGENYIGYFAAIVGAVAFSQTEIPVKLKESQRGGAVRYTCIISYIYHFYAHMSLS